MLGEYDVEVAGLPLNDLLPLGSREGWFPGLVEKALEDSFPSLGPSIPRTELGIVQTEELSDKLTIILIEVLSHPGYILDAGFTPKSLLIATGILAGLAITSMASSLFPPSKWSVLAKSVFIWILDSRVGVVSSMTSPDRGSSTVLWWRSILESKAGVNRSWCC